MKSERRRHTSIHSALAHLNNEPFVSFSDGSNFGLCLSVNSHRVRYLRDGLTANLEQYKWQRFHMYANMETLYDYKKSQPTLNRISPCVGLSHSLSLYVCEWVLEFNFFFLLLSPPFLSCFIVSLWNFNVVAVFSHPKMRAATESFKFIIRNLIRVLCFVSPSVPSLSHSFHSNHWHYTLKCTSQTYNRPKTITAHKSLPIINKRKHRPKWYDRCWFFTVQFYVLTRESIETKRFLWESESENEGRRELWFINYWINFMLHSETFHCHCS